MFHTYESRLVAVQDLGFNRPASFFLYILNSSVSTRRTVESASYPSLLFTLLSLLLTCLLVNPLTCQLVNSSTCLLVYLEESSPERRCSSRTFRYGYLVTT